MDIKTYKDEHKIDRIYEQHKPDVIFHSAACKHVPLMETLPDEANKAKCWGSHGFIGL